MSGPAFEAEGITKYFGDLIALDRVDLTVGRGVVHGLLGPNGAGKTTLLSIVFGLLRPDGGTLRLLGRDTSASGAGRLDGVAGFVESPRFYPYLSARRNLELLAALDDRPAGAGATSRRAAEEARSVSALLDRVGLAEVGEVKVKGFSLGMRQRLGLAAALLRSPELLVLDEPFNGLDPAGMRDLRLALAGLAAEGTAVLLSSHNMGEVEQLCGEVSVLTAGQVAFQGTLDQMRHRAPEPAYRLDTSDDEQAIAVAGEMTGVAAARHDDGGLTVHAGQAALDGLTISLAQRGVAVRHLVLEVTSLESMFLSLTEHDVPDAQAHGRALSPVAGGGRRSSGGRSE